MKFKDALVLNFNRSIRWDIEHYINIILILFYCTSPAEFLLINSFDFGKTNCRYNKFKAKING